MIEKLDAPALFMACDENPGLTIVDVRSPIEFQSEHIEGAINLPVEQFEERSRELPLDNELVFVCRTGTRAKRAMAIASDAGLNCGLLEGGMLSWKKAGLPTIRGKQRLAVDRQVQLTVGLGILTSLGLGLTVNRWFLALAGVFGAGLTYAGASGTCGLAKVLEKAPWNQIDGDACADANADKKTTEKSGSCGGSHSGCGKSRGQ